MPGFRGMPFPRGFLAVLPILLLQSACIDSPATTVPPDPWVSELQLVWDLFDTEYVGFEVGGADWDAVLALYGPLAEEVGSRSEMTVLTAEMLGTLQDPHILLIGPGADTVRTFDPAPWTNCDPEVLMAYLLPWGFTWMQADMWGWCLAGPDSIPYFVIASWQAELNISLFDDVLQPLLDRPGLILDVRLCAGGAEGPAGNAARRFVDRVRVGYLRQERVSGDTHALTDPEPFLLHPRAWFFGNPVVVLTGERNSGASEEFACLLAELPHATLMGETTQGAGNWPADSWELPDGGSVTVPVRTLLRPDTTFIEGTGIPPDIHVQSTPEDFAEGVDPVLESAFEVLGARHP